MGKFQRGEALEMADWLGCWKSGFCGGTINKESGLGFYDGRSKESVEKKGLQAVNLETIKRDDLDGS